MSKKNLRLKSCVCGVLAAAAVSGALAQEDKTTVLEEIIVTAERRAQSLQEVPLSITAFGAETRDLVGIISIQDMANFAPGVSYNTAVDRPSIRGVARQSNSFSLDSPIANYNDGVYTTSVQDAQRRPIFIERTEILRGPQGALSGRGSIGGAINTISKRPNDEFGWEARAAVGDYSRSLIEATFTGPITDWFRVRVNLGKYSQNEGYFENVATGGTEGDQPNNRQIHDYLFEFDIGESVDLFLKAAFANYDESRRTGYSRQPFVAGVLGAPTAYGPSSAALTPLASYGYFPASAGTRLGTHTENPVIATGDVRKFGNDHKSRQWLDDHHNYTADLVWHVPSVDIRWIGAHQNYKYTQITDSDATDVLTMRLPPTTSFPAGRVVSPGTTNTYMEDREWYSNELTVTSTGDGAISWIAGLYQSNEQYQQEPFTLTHPGYNELNTPFGTTDRLLQLLFVPGFNAANAARAVVPNPRPNTSVVGLLDGETISSAAFGQIDYRLNDEWTFTLGLRYNKDEKEVTEATRYIGNGLGDGLGPWLAGGNTSPFIPALPPGPRAVDATPVPVAGAPLPPGVVRDRGIDPVTGYRVRDMKESWTALTGSVGVNFEPTDNDLIYFRFARGYRPGGFNAGFIADPPMVDKESVDSYETGYKTTLFSRLQLATSVFYYDYKDIQLELPTLGRCTIPGDLSTCTTLNSFVNLPSGESKGVEIEANWLATDQLNFILTYGYLDATIKEGLTRDGIGFSNPVDPAAILRNAKRHQPMGQPDTGFTGLPRYTQNLSGNKLANSPEHRAAFNVNYTFNFSPGNLTLSSSYIWRDESYSDVFQTEEFKVPSYATIGARVIWADKDNDYTVMLYGNNLTDEESVDGVLAGRVRTGLTGAAGAAYYPTYNLAPPREFGVEVQFRFGSTAN